MDGSVDCILSHNEEERKKERKNERKKEKERKKERKKEPVKTRCAERSSNIEQLFDQLHHCHLYICPPPPPSSPCMLAVSNDIPIWNGRPLCATLRDTFRYYARIQERI